MRIMTSNIWGDYFNNPVSVREDLLYSVFQKYDADIIGMQEATPGWYAGELFAKLQENYCLLGSETFNTDDYVPLAFKKKYTLLDKGYELLQETPDRSKAITWAVLQDGDKTFAVCNTHFWFMMGPEHDLIREENARQMSTLMCYIHDTYHCPVFAFGDMNTTPSSSVFEIYDHNHIYRLFPFAAEKTDLITYQDYPVLGEDGRYHGTLREGDQSLAIDHIVGLGDGYTVSSYIVATDRNALDSTDHSPVYADIELL
ncbi:MAG: hypothetical protein IJ315_05605 [Firmicutes bacterium]|nr:hypothetical protein [Bacillota bacterium]